MNYGKKATMQLLRKYDNKSSKVKNKFKLIVLKILLVVVIVAGAAGISSGIGVMKGITKSFRDNILSKGGTEDPAVLYKRFRGQEPTIDALLIRNGIKK